MQHNDQKTTSENSLAFSKTDAQQHQDPESSQVLAEIEMQALNDVQGGGGLSGLKSFIKGQKGHSTDTRVNSCPTYHNSGCP
jgi:hypothetical protein